VEIVTGGFDQFDEFGFARETPYTPGHQPSTRRAERPDFTRTSSDPMRAISGCRVDRPPGSLRSDDRRRFRFAIARAHSAGEVHDACSFTMSGTLSACSNKSSIRPP
jgi:hypothetical protein